MSIRGMLKRSRKCAVLHWHSADCFQPSHHGNEIISAAVGAIISQWIIPHLNAHRICARVLVGNIGRVCVLEKDELVSRIPKKFMCWNESGRENK